MKTPPLVSALLAVLAMLFAGCETRWARLKSEHGMPSIPAERRSPGSRRGKADLLVWKAPAAARIAEELFSLRIP